MNAVVITIITNDITGAIQLIPQFVETASIIVAPALARAQNNRINIRLDNLTELPNTVKNHTKLAEIQKLKSEDTKQIRSNDTAALSLLQDPDDIHMYVNELMTTYEVQRT